MARAILVAGLAAAILPSVRGADPLQEAESVLDRAGSATTGSLKVGPLAPAPVPAPAATLAGTTWRHRGSDGADISFTFKDGGAVSANMTGSSREGTYSEAGGKVTIALVAKGPRPAIDIVLSVDGKTAKATKYEVGGKPSYNNGRVFTRE